MKIPLYFFRRQSAFALIATLAILALILVLVVAIASVIHVETRASATSKDLLAARQNAIFGLQVAMEQLQTYAGRDQAVTFPATTVYPPKDVTRGTGELYDSTTLGYRTFAKKSSERSYLTSVGTYLTGTNDPSNERKAWDDALKAYWNEKASSTDATPKRNPRWFGVMNASLRVDRATNPKDSPVDLPAQAYETSGTSKFGEPKRNQLPVWLVSGNEKFTITGSTEEYPDDYLTPDTHLKDPNADPSVVYVVGEGSAPKLYPNATDQANEGAPDGMEGRVKAKKQPIKPDENPATKPTGHYAYWVGDESVKANFAVRDPYFNANKGSVEYLNRLQVPQRVGWERVTAMEPSPEGKATFSLNDPKLENISTSKEIGLLEKTNTVAVKKAAKRNFHSLTAFSQSLLTDTALGGLKKDLTPYLESGLGLRDNDPIADPDRYDRDDPRFKAWGAVNNGFPKSTSGIPTWGQIRQWYKNESGGGGSITPDENTAPVLTYWMLHGGWSYNADTKRIRWHWLPCVVLWNPYDVPLASATYDLDVGISPALWQIFVVNENPTLAQLQADTGGSNWTGNPNDPSTWSFTDTTNAVRSIITGPPDSTNMATGPWPKDDNLGDGTTDAFGRFFYRLTNVNPSISKVSYSVIGSGTNRGPLGPKEFQTQFSPHDPNDPDPSRRPVPATFRFKVVSGFGPGQTKVFTLAQDQEWNRGSVPVTLENNFSPDSPATMWFDALNVVNGPSSAENLRFFFNQTDNGTYAPTFEFKINGKTIAKSSQFGAIVFNNMMTPIRGKAYEDKTGWSGGGNADDDGDGIVNREEQPPKFVSTWRPLYSTSEFSSKMRTQESDNQLSSIWPYGVVWVQPLTTSGGDNQNQTHEFNPAFSRFNLSSKIWSPHPLVEVKRSRWNNNNVWIPGNDLARGRQEGFPRMYYFRSADNTSQQWDNNQANGADGYALITFKNIETIDGRSFLGQSTLPIRNARRAESEILSLGQLQQVNLSQYLWQPSFPVGNAFAAPYTDREAIAGLNSRWIGGEDTKQVGRVAADPENQTLDISYLLNESLWDSYFLSSVPRSGAIDRTVPLPNSRHRLRPESDPNSPEVRDPETAAAHLLNFGALNVNSTSVDAWKALIAAFRDLQLDPVSGASNPTRTAPVSRSLKPVQGAIGFTPSAVNANDIGAVSSNKNYSKLVGGFRYLTDEMIQTLAERVVDEVRLRGPFMSLADFVNRRLVAPEGSNVEGSAWYEARTNGMVGNEGDPATGGIASKYPPKRQTDNQVDFIGREYKPFIGLQGLAGTLQRAIQVSGINGGVNHPRPSVEDRVFTVKMKNAGTEDYQPSGSHFTTAGSRPWNTASLHVQEPTLRGHLDTEHLAGAPAGEAGQLFDGVPGFVTQGDLLAMIGPALTPRGDTFLIRSYGDAVDKNGKILARTWLEAVVQRVPEPVVESGTGRTDKWKPKDSFGRKFKVVKMRWLNPEEV